MCRHWDPHTPDFEMWEKERFEYLESTIQVPMSKLPAWNDVATLRQECALRCAPGSQDLKALKKMTGERLERFLLSRCRAGSELSGNGNVGVRHCPIEIVTEDLKERNMWSSNMGEGEQRAVMEVRLRLEDEYKMMKVLRNDKRFEQQRGDLTDDLDRVIIDTLHAPMRMNEKVLFLLHSKAMDNKTKQNAKTIFNVISTKLRLMGTLGEGWGPSWEDKKTDKLASFALPYDQSKKIFCTSQLPQLHDIIDIACGKRTDDAAQMKQFMTEHALVPPFFLLPRVHYKR